MLESSPELSFLSSLSSPPLVTHENSAVRGNALAAEQGPPTRPLFQIFTSIRHSVRITCQSAEIWYIPTIMSREPNTPKTLRRIAVVLKQGHRPELVSRYKALRQISCERHAVYLKLSRRSHHEILG